MIEPAADDRRTRKRLATRQRISDVASQLFIRRGFDTVTIDQIAQAADVARMTVFNHFARKEDMFFDLDEQGRQDLLDALEQRRARTSLLEALRQFAHQAIAEERPYVRFFDGGSERFMKTIAASEALKARARAIRDELTEMIAGVLTSAAGENPEEPTAHLVAALTVASWEVAFLEAHRVYRETHDIAAANEALLAVVDQAARGVRSAAKGSPYV